jgi:hypothetical protein
MGQAGEIVVNDLETAATTTELLHRAGQGNWGAFRALSMDLSLIREAAKKWERRFDGIQLPWLCWNVSDDWCLVQQRLAESAGWTPVVGFDPRVGPPARLSPKAVVVDFNEGLGLPVLYPHFPMEFVFLFTQRLAFWHSDLLLRLPLMSSIAQRFAAQPDGSTTVTASSPGLRYALLGSKRQRHFELIGCTTRAASRSQFDLGCGWWMEFWDHPNCPSTDEREARRRKYYWDHGTGIYFWDKAMGGDVTILKESKAVREGHFTKIGNKTYKRSIVVGGSDAQRSMSQEITANFDLLSACQKMGLESLLRAPAGMAGTQAQSAA